MQIAHDIAKIASNNKLSGIAGVDHAAGNPVPTSQLKSFKALTAADGVYYNKALNTLVITKAGATFDGYDFRGVSINVQVDNVTFKNSTFDASAGKYAINAFPGTKNLTIDHSTFDGLKADNIAYVLLVTSRGFNTVITNSAFFDISTDAISIQSGKVVGNILSDAGYAATAHSDGIWVPKTIGPVVIADNIIDWRAQPDSQIAPNNAVRITGEGGNVSDVLVTNNIILGGSTSVLVSDGATQTHSASQVGSVTGVKVVGNVIDYGIYGDLEQTFRPKDMIYADNMHASGRPTAPGLEAVGALPNLASLNKITAASPTAAIYGTSKGDYILGGSGSNFIQGGSGSDVIIGGGGRDYIAGGAGKDIFVYHSLTADGIDRISDFIQGVDRIDLDGLAGAPETPGGWQWLGNESFTGHAWQLRNTYAQGVTTVELDANGDLKADFKLELAGKIDLKTSDFILAAPTLTQPAPPADSSAPPSPTDPSTPPAPTVPVDPPAPPAPAEPALPSLVLQAPSSGGQLAGKAGAELLLGSDRNDGLSGGAGNDVLVGHAGKDILHGGAGHDTFRFEKAGDSTAVTGGRDYIGDFVRGQDVIDLHVIDANALTTANEAFTWIGARGFSGSAGELRVQASGAGQQVQADLNGDGKADFAIDVAAKGHLAVSDFWL